ncbi:MAG: hypothetical protein HKP58_06255, partial [Desulfatitalea sp.]|nr:hypothetical protein [Desulfatitalea sp.]NNJ99999.1 hypothetical protein [Desulfatitalea sp.]
MASKRKIVSISCAIAGLFLGAALVTAGIYLNSASFRDRLINSVNPTISGRILIENHHLSLLSGRLVLGGVRLEDAGGHAIVELATVRINIALPALLRRTLHVEQLVLADVSLRLAQTSDGQLNLTHAVAPVRPRSETSDPPDRPQTATWNLRVDDLRLLRTRIRYHLLEKKMTIDAAQLTVTGQGDLGQRTARLKAAVGHLHLRSPRLVQAADDVILEAAYDPLARRPISIALRLADNTVDMDADLDLDNRFPRITASAALNLDLAKVLDWVPAAVDLTGRAQGRITATGNVFDPVLTVSLTGDNLCGYGLKGMQVALEGGMARRQVDIRRLVVTNPVGRVALSGALDMQAVFPESFQQAQADIHSAAYRADVRLQAIAPEKLPWLKWPLPGLYHGGIVLSGTGFSPSHMTAKAHVDLAADGVRAAPEGQALNMDLAADVDLAEQRLTLSGGRLDVGDNGLTLAG